MAKKFICVEVGDRIVKVCVALGTEKKRKVKDAFFFEAPNESVQDGLIFDPERFANKLIQEMGNHKCTDAKEIVFTVASTKIPTREVKMPLLTDQKIATVVENNKGTYFPMELEDQTVLFRVMSREKKGNDKGCDVLVMAMPNVMVEACAETADYAGLKLKCVDAACSSMVDGVSLLKQGNITAFVNVEASTTNICVMKGSTLLAQRSVSFGGDEMLMAYIEKSDGNVDYLEALDDLCGPNAESNIRGKLDDDDITSLLDRTVGGISRGIEFFNTNKGGGIGHIVLMGTCGNILGIDDLLEQQTGIDTLQMSQLGSATSLRNISDKPAYYMTSMYAGATALNFATDLDPKKQKSKRAVGKQEVDLPTVILIFMLCVVFSVYWGYSAVLEHAEMEKTLSRLESEIEEMDEYDKIEATHSTYKDSRDKLLNFTQLTRNPNENLVEFLAELEAKMPSEILILSAVCSSTTVSLNIVVNSVVEAATVLSKLRTFDTLGSISSSGLNMSWIQFEGEEYSQEMQDGFEEVSFSVVCTYGVNPYTSYINPYSSVLGIDPVPNIPPTETPTPGVTAPEPGVTVPEGEVYPEGEVPPEGGVAPEGDGTVVPEGEGGVAPEGEGVAPESEGVAPEGEPSVTT